MDITKAIILGIIQGLTEFLPISSSGHLVLGKELLNIPEQGIAFEIFVHFGTLLAVLTVFRNDILELIKAFFLIFKNKDISETYKENINFRLLVYIIIGTIPAVIIGLAFEDKIEQAFNDPHLVCLMLLVTGLILLFTYWKPKQTGSLTIKNTLIMGVAQAFAIFPGISRSGSTISAGIFFRVSGNEAARFSFLLAVPAIFGATLLKVSELFQTGISSDFLIQLIVGTIAAYISGYIAIETLLNIVKKGKLYLFAPYCFILGILGLLFL